MSGPMRTHELLPGGLFDFEMGGLWFSFQALRHTTVAGRDGSVDMFHCLEELVATGDVQLLEPELAERWDLACKIMNGTATEDDHTRWTALVTSMRIRGEIDANTYAKLKP